MRKIIDAEDFRDLADRYIADAGSLSSEELETLMHAALQSPTFRAGLLKSIKRDPLLKAMYDLGIKANAPTTAALQ